MGKSQFSWHLTITLMSCKTHKPTTAHMEIQSRKYQLIGTGQKVYIFTSMGTFLTEEGTA